MTPETNSKVLQAILKIQAGDKQAREDFLQEYKPFVAKTAMNLCKRTLEWGQKDELSIALIGLNSAIDSYDAKKQVPFLPYAKVVIQNRLKDYFRKESRLSLEVPLESESDEGKIISPAEVQAAWEDYRERTIEDERQEELAEFEELLGTYGIDFETLVGVSPKHKDSRQTLLQIAAYIKSRPEILNHLLIKKQLPVSDLVSAVGVNRKTIERGRKFIIASVLVMHYANQFPYISSYVNLGSN
ncbi:MAG: RNA polymerase sigma-I factor [Thermincola sp.]|jgi:RNA polymerase sigma factor|nr:RNA polymerase sigma-I factor [Thermincola sp.]MDT3703256.1 RNA polymerase sigma-I factor [Thermincola sp.]